MSAAAAIAVFFRNVCALPGAMAISSIETTVRFATCDRETASDVIGTPLAGDCGGPRGMVGEVASAPPVRRRLTLANRVA